MLDALPIRVDSVAAQAHEGRKSFAMGYGAVLGVGLFVAIVGVRGAGNHAEAFALALGILICGAAAILWRPIAGVYLTVFFSLLGDSITMPGYPFNLNFSSRESFLYIHDSLTFTPIELYLVLTFISWFVHAAGARCDWRVLGRPLLWPMVIFTAFVGVGVGWGMATGGSLYVATWELRPLLYLGAMFILASNLFTKAIDYVRLAWLVVLAISIQNLFALWYYYTLSAAARSKLEALTEHPTSLMYGWILLLTLGLWVFRGCSWKPRVLLLLTCIPTMWVFVLSQRRGAVVALLAGFGLFGVVLFFRRPKAFLLVVPVVLVLTAGYTAAFWNATDGIGFGARAIKSVVASDQVSSRDSSSDLYRQVENFDLVATIKAKPVTGVGFGNAFFQPAPLPNISFFVFYQYIPHNQFLWIWLKLGYAGFVTMFVVIAAALRAGTRAAMRVPSGDVLAASVAAVAFVVMFFVFTFVDISWEPKTCLFLAVCLASCANIERLSRAERVSGTERSEQPPRAEQPSRAARAERREDALATVG